MLYFLDYLDLTGYAIPYYYYEISKFFGTGLFINLFYLLVLNKIPRIVLILDAIFVIFFGLLFINGIQFPSIINKQVQGVQSIYHKVFYVFYFTFILNIYKADFFCLFFLIFFLFLFFSRRRANHFPRGTRLFQWLVLPS